MSASSWWLQNGAHVPELQHVAVIVLSQVVSASSSERNWKEYDYVHNKRRNRLSIARATELVRVHSSLVLLENAAKEDEFHPWHTESDDEEEEAGQEAEQEIGAATE